MGAIGLVFGGVCVVPAAPCSGRGRASSRRAEGREPAHWCCRPGWCGWCRRRRRCRPRRAGSAAAGRIGLIDGGGADAGAWQEACNVGFGGGGNETCAPSSACIVAATGGASVALWVCESRLSTDCVRCALWCLSAVYTRPVCCLCVASLCFVRGTARGYGHESPEARHGHRCRDWPAPSHPTQLTAYVRMLKEW